MKSQTGYYISRVIYMWMYKQLISIRISVYVSELARFEEGVILLILREGMVEVPPKAMRCL